MSTKSKPRLRQGKSKDTSHAEVEQDAEKEDGSGSDVSSCDTIWAPPTILLDSDGEKDPDEDDGFIEKIPENKDATAGVGNPKADLLFFFTLPRVVFFASCMFIAGIFCGGAGFFLWVRLYAPSGYNKQMMQEEHVEDVTAPPPEEFSPSDGDDEEDVSFSLESEEAIAVEDEVSFVEMMQLRGVRYKLRVEIKHFREKVQKSPGLQDEKRKAKADKCLKWIARYVEKFNEEDQNQWQKNPDLQKAYNMLPKILGEDTDLLTAYNTLLEHLKSFPDAILANPPDGETEEMKADRVKREKKHQEEYGDDRVKKKKEHEKTKENRKRKKARKKKKDSKKKADDNEQADALDKAMGATSRSAEVKARQHASAAKNKKEESDGCCSCSFAEECSSACCSFLDTPEETNEAEREKEGSTKTGVAGTGNLRGSSDGWTSNWAKIPR
ncbi:unnamed protein product [Amoebophrya sp. A25]|nr:unnamed protein product [Amoebophrya sp. A25]|eukprot:GSA25T00019208001.1